MEANLEPWEGVNESLQLLRGLVCSKVGIREDIKEMEERRQALRTELARLDSRVAEATEKWAKVDAFMKKFELATGFDPIPF